VKLTLAGEGAAKFGIQPNRGIIEGHPELTIMANECPTDNFSNQCTFTAYLLVNEFEMELYHIEDDWWTYVRTTTLVPPLTGNENVTLTLHIGESTYSQTIPFADPSEPLTALSLNGTFTEQNYYQGYGPTFFHGNTKTYIENDFFRQHLQAVKTPVYSNEQIIWSITGNAAGKYELYDARVDGNLVPFNEATNVANVFVSIKEGETIDARGNADRVTISVQSAINNALTGNMVINVRADMSTVWGDFSVYEKGSLVPLTDETVFLYVVDTEEEQEPQQREINYGSYELNLYNSLAEHLFHASVSGMLLLNENEIGFASNNTKIFTPYDELGADNSPGPIFNFNFVRLPRISGKVVDQSGAPIVGASIFGGIPTQTDKDGKFTITLSEEAYRENAGEKATITAMAAGYEPGNAEFTIGGLDIAALKSGTQDKDDIVITLTKSGTGNSFTDATKNALRLSPSMITSAQFSTAMAYMHSDVALTNATITITANNNAALKDASGTMHIYELPSYTVTTRTVTNTGGTITFTMPEIKAGTEYFFSFGVNGPPLDKKPRINHLINVAIKVNDHNTAAAALTVNDLTMESPMEIGVEDDLNIYGIAAMSNNANLKLEIFDVQNLGGKAVAEAQTQAKKDQIRYSFEKVKWTKKPGVYEVVVTVINSGSEKDAVARRTLIVTPAPVRVTSVSYYDKHTSPKVMELNPSANLVFPIHVWLLDEWRLYDDRKPNKIEVGLHAETQETDYGTGGEIIGVEIIIETSHGIFTFDAEKEGSVYVAEITELAGVGIAEVFANVTRRSYTDPTQIITIKTKIVNLSLIVDPSGYVYDVATGDRIQGATATLYRKDEDTGDWVIWNAENYQQVNPQITDEEGKYGWMVPEGEYEVRITMAGYHNYTTLSDAQYGVIKILPAREDINIGLVSTTTPIRLSQVAANIHAKTIGKSIVLENVPQGAKVEVYNLQGKRVYYSPFSILNSQLIIKTQTNGMYIIKVNNQVLRVVVAK
jgi:hypothetical protein